MGLTSLADGYPMVLSVEKVFPDSPNPMRVHHQCEPMLIVNQKILTENQTTYTKPYES